MAVNLVKKQANELSPINGMQIFVGQAGIKKKAHNDLTLLVLDSAATLAAVFTQNKFCAAPVYLCRQYLAQQKPIKALLINTGNANAGTGSDGRQKAYQVCQAVAKQIGCEPEQVLPFSTGVIMETLPVEKIIDALPKLTESNWAIAAEAIMTTDTVPKSSSKVIFLDGKQVSITGIAKGSGMICPNMATMLAFLATDAKVTQAVLDILIKEIVADSFNSITVDGDTSTNDSFVLIATNKSEAALINDIESLAYQQLKKVLQEVALELATAIIRDGEGATKFISIAVNGAKTKAEAKQVGYSIANSPLVKTAFFASDANLGRILCAIGNSQIDDLDVNQIALFLGDILVAEQGAVAECYKDQAGQAVMAQDEITIRVELNRGNANAVVYTCDFSYDYVKINADYRS